MPAKQYGSSAGTKPVQVGTIDACLASFQGSTWTGVAYNYTPTHFIDNPVDLIEKHHICQESSWDIKARYLNEHWLGCSVPWLLVNDHSGAVSPQLGQPSDTFCQLRSNTTSPHSSFNSTRLQPATIINDWQVVSETIEILYVSEQDFIPHRVRGAYVRNIHPRQVTENAHHYIK